MDDGIERGVRRREPDLERLRQGRALELGEERGEDVGEARRHGREPRRGDALGGGEVGEARRAVQGTAVPARGAEEVAESEEVGGDAPRVGPPRLREGARAVVEVREPRRVRRDALRVRRRLAAQAVEAAEPLREPQGADALEARARLAGREGVAPGRAAVRGGEEDAEHGVPGGRRGSEEPAATSSILRRGRTGAGGRARTRNGGWGFPWRAPVGGHARSRCR